MRPKYNFRIICYYADLAELFEKLLEGKDLKPKVKTRKLSKTDKCTIIFERETRHSYS